MDLFQSFLVAVNEAEKDVNRVKPISEVKTVAVKQEPIECDLYINGRHTTVDHTTALGIVNGYVSQYHANTREHNYYAQNLRSVIRVIRITTEIESAKVFAEQRNRQGTAYPERVQGCAENALYCSRKVFRNHHPIGDLVNLETLMVNGNCLLSKIQKATKREKPREYNRTLLFTKVNKYDTVYYVSVPSTHKLYRYSEDGVLLFRLAINGNGTVLCELPKTALTNIPIGSIKPIQDINAFDYTAIVERKYTFVPVQGQFYFHGTIDLVDLSSKINANIDKILPLIDTRELSCKVKKDLKTARLNLKNALIGMGYDESLVMSKLHPSNYYRNGLIVQKLLDKYDQSVVYVKKRSLEIKKILTAWNGTSELPDDVKMILSYLG
jgi:hypothetical protein